MRSYDNSNEVPRVENLIGILWRNWCVAYGAITLPLLVSLFLPKVFIPFVALFEVWALTAARRTHFAGLVGAGSFLVIVAVNILFITAMAMFIVLILCTDWLVPTVIFLDLYNSEIPFITALVEFPTTAGVCALWLYTGMADHNFRKYQRRHGYYAGDSIPATLYFRETRYQATILLALSVAIGGVEYWYYFDRYINSDLNAPDRFFFNYMPVAIYFISLIFMWGRYASMKELFNTMNESSESKKNRTTVRYLIFHGEELMLHSLPDGLWDTPIEAIVARTNSLGDIRARQLFEQLSGLTDFQLRYCYTNDGFASGSNIIHYAVFVHEVHLPSLQETENAWFNPYMIDRALASNRLADVLANELFRIHTITMAWKTYDRSGRRLYPIRHYRPTFRFSDLPKWQVDYDDHTWFDIANNNEDRRFFRMRRFWQHITGVFRRDTMTQ